MVTSRSGALGNRHSIPFTGFGAIAARASAKKTIVAPIPDDSRGDAEAQRDFTTKAAKGTKNRWNENGRESAPRRDADV